MNRIRIELTDGELPATLLEDFNDSIQGLKFTVPAGFKTDFASVPRWLWWFIAPMGKHSAGALVHDYLYSKRLYARRICDAIFLELMKKKRVGWFKRFIMWASVRMFGGSHFKK